MGRPITLGAHDYEVRPQKVGYLINRLGPKLQEALEAEIEGVDGGAILVGAKAHDVLKVFIPDLMPVHEFVGFVSHDAMVAGEYSEATDQSPEPLQIKDAFKAASDVNGGEVLSHLKALLGPALTQRVVALVTAVVSERAQEALTFPTTPPSSTSQPPSGASDPTNSGTTAPTPPQPASVA